ncbi:MAG: hypothetical protein JXR76_14640 [Deltaproteobacteria bacterium]|nr:hypothetical protein [Deltaproteobacteria bacterium]
MIRYTSNIVVLTGVLCAMLACSANLGFDMADEDTQSSGDTDTWGGTDTLDSMSTDDTQPSDTQSDTGAPPSADSVTDHNCVPEVRDCSSAMDNNCNNFPDNEEPQCTTCTLNNIEQCDVHAGLDGKGICRSGTRTCVLSSNKQSVGWAPCRGAVGPKNVDCSSEYDNNCDGLPDRDDPKCDCETDDIDTDCFSVPWADAPNAAGICHTGTRKCTGTNIWGACEGEQGPGLRDCTSGLDNNCDGTPDNQESACKCDGEFAGVTRNCGDFEQFWDVGQCRAGHQKCEIQPDRTAAAWSPCMDEVAPKIRNCTSDEDYNCNKIPDNSETACMCDGVNIVGEEKDCGNSPQFWGIGQCHAGKKMCELLPGNSAVGWGECIGEVEPTAEECGPMAADADCDGIAGYNKGSCTTVVYLTGHNAAGDNPRNWCDDHPLEPDFGVISSVINGQSLAVSVFAYTSLPLQETHDLLATFKVFKDAHENTRPLVRCKFRQFSLFTYFVSIADEDGQCPTDMASKKITVYLDEPEIVGYVSTVDAEGYSPLRSLYISSTARNYYNGIVGRVPMASSNCPELCMCLDSEFFSIP